MVHPAELRRREQRQREADGMLRAAEELRIHGPGGYAGLNRDAAAAMSELLVQLAGGWREKPAAPRVWEAGVRVAERVLGPIHDPAPRFPGPLPAGYAPPRRD